MFAFPLIIGFFAGKQMLEFTLYPFAYAAKVTDAVMRSEKN